MEKKTKESERTFAFTAKEVDIARFAISEAIRKHEELYEKRYYMLDRNEKSAFENVIMRERNLLTRIKQWQDDNIN